MLSLVNLCRTANPTASTEDINTAIKRKFLSGVFPDLRHSIFISVLLHMRPQSHMMPFSKPLGRPSFLLSIPVMILHNHLLLLPPPSLQNLLFKLSMNWLTTHGTYGSTAFTTGSPTECDSHQPSAQSNYCTFNNPYCFK